MTVEIINGDALTVLRGLPAESINCCITSPPYWNKRDYGVAGQLGLEPTLDEHVAKLVEIFREVRRVLRRDGTFWLNLGDTFAQSGGPGWQGKNGQRAGRRFTLYREGLMRDNTRRPPALTKHKDLLGVPWLIAKAIQRPWLRCQRCSHEAHFDQWGRWPNGRMICPACMRSRGAEVSEPGWYLRRDIIWEKPNCTPESCKDRPTTSHDYIFLLTKSAKYFYDAKAFKVPCSPDTRPRYARGRSSAHKYVDGGAGNQTIFKALSHMAPGVNPKARRITTSWGTGKGNHRNRIGRYKQNESLSAAVIEVVGERNMRSVWTVPTSGFRGMHFATFPAKLVLPCVLLGSPAGGIVLDPFAGSGTVGMVAEEQGRDSILIELNPEYCKIARTRTAQARLPL